ncbi:MAG: hypothetical protein NTZ05_17675, partial [Chloroflexi bacterium]|nr:hypothetical protein [Chloroflexota bacterium]
MDRRSIMQVRRGTGPLSPGPFPPILGARGEGRTGSGLVFRRDHSGGAPTARRFQMVKDEREAASS